MAASPDQFDLIVLGAGPAGYVGAIRAAQLGMRTAVVERAQLGGICLNWGCIPTKALLHSADILREVRGAGHAGIRVADISVDLDKVVANSRTSATALNAGVRHLLKKNDVQVFQGEARIKGRRVVEVTDSGGDRTVLQGRNIMVATGARARNFPGLPPLSEGQDGHIWSYKEALTPPALPASLLVIGAGAIGMEFASFYAAFGTSVTVVEALDRVLPAEDEDVSAFVQAAFQRDGITVRTACRVTEIAPQSASVSVTLNYEGQSNVQQFERVLVSIGVTGNIENIGLETVPGVQTHAGFIVSDKYGVTGEAGIYAVGDVAGAPWLAHKASHQAIICVEHIAGLAGAHAVDANRIPAATFCHPQVASVGLTEQQARERGHPFKVGKFPFAANGRAVAAGLGDGFVKTIFDDSTGELLGAHMVGSNVTELIHGFSLAQQLEATEDDLIRAIYPHPTLSEMLPESVMMAFDRALHI